VDGLLEKLKDDQPQHACLFSGERGEVLASVAPYLVRLEEQTPFTDWVLEQGWGKHWGIFVLSNAELPDMQMHFGRLVIVHDPAGQPMYFRFYDPRVMATYLPTCTPQELAEVFGPVVSFVMEGEEPSVRLRFQFDGAKLIRREDQPVPV
jgi:hypothetical protein